ncbi:MAG TPA: MFS transporter [Steroidobacteraceae bacterium]|nr:MFS transporter [Steroidobacteraceae bacterium]
MSSAAGNLTSHSRSRWLNRTVVGVGLASLFSDWSHEIATTVMPAFLATLGVAAAWLGLIEGVSDGVSSFAKLASGYYTDRLQRRKPIAVAGYVVTALGTAAFGLATAAWHVLIARATAWLGRGVRTPVRKALLAGAVTPQTYGRAFGFERMMDTVGAIVGPLTALFLLQFLHDDYPTLFALTLVPGLLAAAVMAFVVHERNRTAVSHVSFGDSLRALPHPFRRFLAAVTLFGMGDFSHTLLILLAIQKLTPQWGAAAAASIGAGLYVLHNVVYAGFSMVAGVLADRLHKGRVLASGYALAAVMALAIMLLPMNLWTLAVIFTVAGSYVAIEETLEDSCCAALVTDAQHGMAFGTLATLNGLGDVVSSIVVGLLWTRFGTSVAFAYSAVLFLIGSAMILRVMPARARGRKE